jgi:hypothetical protein
MCTSREAVGTTSQADLIISTRYHPLVFATAQAIPGFGLYSDEYTYIKLQGALEHAGGEQWIMLLELAFTDLFPEAILELWSKRHAIRSQFENKRSEIQAMEVTKRQRLATALGLPNVPGEETMSAQAQSAIQVSATAHQPKGAWAEISARVNKHLVDAMAGRSYYKLVSEESTRYALSLKAALDAKGQKPSIFKR